MEAFKIRRERRGLTLTQAAKLAGVGYHLARRYEYGTLHFTQNDALKKLDKLNKKWAHEEH